jgi:hypothetical protein
MLLPALTLLNPPPCLHHLHRHQAPTPFLMGLHSSEPVEGRVLDLLVVADLDAGTLQAPRDDVLLRQCMGHPYMQRLLRRVRCVGVARLLLACPRELRQHPPCHPPCHLSSYLVLRCLLGVACAGC